MARNSEVEAAASLSVLSLNINHLADLAGLPGLLRELGPDFVFVQEVGVAGNSLSAAASSLGYKVHFSTCENSRHTIAVLSRRQLEVSDVVAGFVQQVKFDNLVFLHFHCHSGSSDVVARNNLFLQCRPIISSLPVPPFLVGDFNCIIDRFDVEIYEYRKFSQTLAEIVQNFSYFDSFRYLYPAVVQYSWFKRNFSASRLDRLYLPAVFANSCFISRYIPTVSDHSAYYVVMNSSALGIRLEKLPRASQFYWKLNSAILSDVAFLPAFEQFWRPLEAEVRVGEEAAWWEERAKPEIQRFCMAFSKTIADRAAQTRRFIVRALDLALSAGDWTTVEGCRDKLKQLDLQKAVGLAVRTHLPLVEGEVPSIFHLAAEGRHGRSPGLEAVRDSHGNILREAAAVQSEIFSYFGALFNGRHQTSAECPEPFDSGISFHPDVNAMDQFLEGLPSLEAAQREALDRPFELGELEEAVSGAAAGKSPGLDGLSYEFYKKTFSLVGKRLLVALNRMLEEGELRPSLRRGVVRLLPKVKAVPTAAQLRPITLLGVDYKLLTKMFVARMVPVLPDVLASSQLCSVRGRSIFDGAAAILSTAEYLFQRQRPGFLVNLDLFHAYDRVDLSWVDRVLEAMGFGPLLRQWISVLHRGASACFMLHGLTPDLQILFSLRQGDPLAMILFVIQIEPLLVALERLLAGVWVGAVREAALGYVDDVVVLGEEEGDLQILDVVVRDFESVSGAILNRNRKSVLLGLGSWAERAEWPLTWINIASEVKIYGVIVTAAYNRTVSLSWGRVIDGLEAVLHMWTARFLPTLASRTQALEVFAFSKLWYLAQILPMPAVQLKRIKKAAGAFLWKGRLERLAWDELHGPLYEGGLALSCVASRAQALLAKQACHRLAAGGRPFAHLAYWIGLRLKGHLASLGRGPHSEVIPAFMSDLSRLLLEVFELECVEVANLGAVAAKSVYAELLSTPTPPKVEAKWPAFCWP